MVSETLTREILTLLPEDRIRLADMILQSLNPDVSPDIEKKWIEESQRRFEGYSRGEIPAFDVSDCIHDLKKKYEV